MGDESHARSRNEHGQYMGRILLGAALEVSEARGDAACPLAAADVIEVLDCSRCIVHNKLNKLEAHGDLVTRKVGTQSRVFWTPTPVYRGPTTGRAVDSADSISTTETVAMDEVEIDGPNDLDHPSAVSSVIERVNLPGSGPMLDTRRKALSVVYQYLTDRPEAKRVDLLWGMYYDYPAGFESAEDWRNAIQPALKQLPGIDPLEECGRVWYFLGR